ncbi:MAG: hypothetical protein K5785_03465 [Nitrosarchaeum sp.]|nr:hypothetical protein [Nitrosarchaeum sp.]
MKKRQTAKQEKIMNEIKKTNPKLTLISHDEYANLWNPEVFPISNKYRFYREIQSKIEQSFSDFHYAFSPLPNSYKAKILSSRSFEDFMTTLKYASSIADQKQSDEDPDKIFSFIMYYNFFNIGLEGLMKLMPEEFKWHIREQLRDTLLLMQSIAKFTKNTGSKKQVPFVHAPDSLLSKGTIENLE